MNPRKTYSISATPEELETLLRSLRIGAKFLELEGREFIEEAETLQALRWDLVTQGFGDPTIPVRRGILGDQS